MLIRFEHPKSGMLRNICQRLFPLTASSSSSLSWRGVQPAVARSPKAMFPASGTVWLALKERVHPVERANTTVHPGTLEGISAFSFRKKAFQGSGSVILCRTQLKIDLHESGLGLEMAHSRLPQRKSRSCTAQFFLNDMLKLQPSLVENHRF